MVSAARLTVVEWNLQAALVTGEARIDVVPKTGDPRELIMQADLVCALGPGRIILEAVGMNRAAICLNTSGRGEYFTERNRMKLEYYMGDWGESIDALLTPAQVSAHQNHRAVIQRHYDRNATLRHLVRHLEALEKRPSSRLDSALRDLRTAPLIMAEYARLLEFRLESREPTHRARSRVERSYAICRRLVPHRVRTRIGRIRALQSVPQPPSLMMRWRPKADTRGSHDHQT